MNAQWSNWVTVHLINKCWYPPLWLFGVYEHTVPGRTEIVRPAPGPPRAVSFAPFCRDARKARLDPRRWDVRFSPISCCSTRTAPRRPPLAAQAPLTLLGRPVHCAVLEQTAPNTCRLELPPGGRERRPFAAFSAERQNHHLASPPSRATRSTRCRKSRASACTTARPNASSAGPERTHREIHCMGAG